TSLLKPLCDVDYKAGLGDKQLSSFLDASCVFAIIWSIGAATNTATRKSFDIALKKLLAGSFEGIKQLKKITPALPERGSCFDFVYRAETNTWAQWMDTVESAQSFPPGTQPAEIIVQTVDMVRYSYLANMNIEAGVFTLFCGPTGTGKTAYALKVLDSLQREKNTYIPLGFSAQTSENQTQDLIDAKLEKRRRDTFGPPLNKRCILFVDDLNMPAKEKWGAQPPIEILRQYCDHGGWYDRKDLTHPFRHIIDCMLFAAMGPPGGGRTFISPRLLRHFHLLGFIEVEDENLIKIFTAILDWKFTTDSYPPDVAGISKKIVAATMDVYKLACTELLPTPVKSHYTFNLRDFSKVILGVLLMGKEQQEGVEKVVRLWIHEVLRVFGDRLVDETDQTWLLKNIRDISKKCFGQSFDTVMAHLDSNKDGKVDTLDEIRKLFFGDYMNPPSSPKRPYDEVKDFDELQTKVEGYLEQLNIVQSSKRMNLVLFSFAIEHLSRISRILKIPGGNALLVGVGGSGRQSLTRLACFMCDAEVFQIEISKNYGKNEWREDLKEVLRRAGGKGETTVFLFSDTQIKQESFVEDINNLLNTGEVPNLYAPDEKSQICEMVRAAARQEGKAPEGTPQQLYNFFVDRCKRLLHVVLCFSPIGDAFRTRVRQFPSLVNCCTINWFSKWPDDALSSVAERFLSSVDMEEDVRKGCVSMCQVLHSGARGMADRFLAELKRYYYVTPTSYLELITTFKTLLAEQREQVSAMKSRYEVGLDKLKTTENSVEGMQRELTDLQPILETKGQETAEMMKVVAAETDKTAEIKEVVAGEEAIASEAAEKANSIKTECEQELAVAMPALESAIKALNTLTSGDIAEIKAMKSPPGPVKIVLEAVCVLKGVKPQRIKDPAGGSAMINDFWGPSQKMVADTGFLKSLMDYDKDNIPADVIKKIAKYVQEEDFEPEKVKKVSKAAYGLCCWVRAMETYDRVAKVVAPKKEALKIAEAEYSKVMEGLNIKRAQLKEVEDKLAGLNAELKNKEDEKNTLEAQVEDCKAKLIRAEQLIESLGGEKARWTEKAESLTIAYTNLTGDIMIASGIIAYLGAFTPGFRNDGIAEWVKTCKDLDIPGTATFSLTNCLGEPVKIRAWTMRGLPNDNFSIENGIIMDKSRRWPLCIDPQGQANKWIKKMEQPNKLVVAKLSDSDYLRRLEGSIQFGTPVLIENIAEELDPALEPVLLKQTFKKAGTLMIKLGDATIEYSENFRFYLTTKLRNPHYLPEVAVKVTLLNFMITQAGLQDQLLGIVVAKEKPDLEEEKARLIVEGAENKKQLKEIEDKILHVLSASQGNILDDETAIQVLSAAKQLSNEIAEKQKIAEETEERIDEARLGYVPVAFRASTLFFCIADLAAIDPMYQYSLPFFVNLFIACIAKAPQSEDHETRLRHLNEFFTLTLYRNICRSLFEKHKLLFSFLLCARILQSEEKMGPVEYRFLLTGGVGLEDVPTKPADWLPDRAWTELNRLEAMSGFSGVASNFSLEEGNWRRLYDSHAPYGEAFPDSCALLDGFQKLLVVRCIRPDKLIPAIMEFVGDNMSEEFVTPPPFDLPGSYADSSNTSPLIFILSPGSDPFAAVAKFAESREKEVAQVSLGQGQGPRARALIDQATQSGGWVVLQNCHLAVSWMPTLERICEQMNPDKIHREFRLWLTSYPSDKFPVAILQNGVKMTNEPPKGLRANLTGSYLTDPISDPDFFNACTKDPEFKRLLFSLCFFHAVIQERRNFGPLGWNISYEFNESDMRISVRQLQMFLDEYPDETPFKALRYLTGECNYGGRVTDDKDRRLLMTLMNDYYSPTIFEEEFNFGSAEYHPIQATDHEAYLEYIKTLPPITEPEIFGFHANANITKEQNETYALVDALLMTESGGSAAAGKSPEEIVSDVAADILNRVPKSWDVAAVQRRYPVLYEESMNTVLCQELTRYNKLIDVIRSSLKDMQKAIKGLAVLSPQLEAAFKSIVDGKIPDMWAAKSYPSLKPLGSYVNDLVERLKFFQSWVDSGAPPVFWLSGFYFTQSFLTGVTQNFARKHKIAVDLVDFDFAIPNETPTEAAESGAYVAGLFIEGAKWDYDKGTLGESDPKVLFVPCPTVWLKPAEAAKIEPVPHYNCPLYKTSARRGVLSTTGHSTNFVMWIKLPSDKEQGHWVKRGVALLTQLDS
ncbi:unnamed protein product, partial [Vitrella brassicaformis CCMP3155]